MHISSSITRSRSRLRAATPFASAVLALALSACAQQNSSPADDPLVGETDAVPVRAPAPVAPSSPPPLAESDANPVLPSPLVPEAEKGEKGARNILLAFARALENEQFPAAYAMLGQPLGGEEEALFMRQFSDLQNITVAVPTGTVEGGAGSLYYSSEATITAQDADGRPIRYEGPITLRRVNDVDGATPAQLRWHFTPLELVQTH
jgi:hypothetical protein